MCLRECGLRRRPEHPCPQCSVHQTCLGACSNACPWDSTRHCWTAQPAWRLRPISSKASLLPGAASVPPLCKAHNREHSNNPSQLRENCLMHTEVLRWRISLRVCSTLICSPVSDLTVPMETGFKSLVNEGNGAAFQSYVKRAHKLFSSYWSCHCEAAWECMGRVPSMSSTFVMRIHYREEWLERMPVCQCCWGEQAGHLKLIRADNYFSRIKGLNGNVWGILLHFGCFHCYHCLLSPKIIYIQTRGDIALWGESHACSLPSGLQLLSYTPKWWPWVPHSLMTWLRPLLCPPLYWSRGGMKAGKGNEGIKRREAQWEAVQPRSSDKGPGLWKEGRAKGKCLE